VPGLADHGLTQGAAPASNSATKHRPVRRKCCCPSPGRRRARRLQRKLPSRSGARLDQRSVALWFVRWLGPVFRIGRNPAVSLFLGRKIPDMRDGAISSIYGNGPTTVLDHPRMEFWFLAHGKNTRLQQESSLPNWYWPVSDRRGPNSKSVVACFGFGAHIGACQNHITDPVRVARFTAEQSLWLRAARSPASSARFAE
jgi:hypothetical protein